MLEVLSLKSLIFQVQCLMFYLSKVQRFKLKSLTFQAQEFNVPSSKAQISSLESCCPTLLCLLFCSTLFTLLLFFLLAFPYYSIPFYQRIDGWFLSTEAFIEGHWMLRSTP